LRDEARAEIGFRFDDRGDELRREIVAARFAINDLAVRHLALEEVLLRDLEREALRGKRRCRECGAHLRCVEDGKLAHVPRLAAKLEQRRKTRVHRFRRNSDGSEDEWNADDQREAAAFDGLTCTLRKTQRTAPHRALATCV